MKYRFKAAQLSPKRLFVSWQFADYFNQSPKPLSSTLDREGSAILARAGLSFNEPGRPSLKPGD
jgi:hypothetical protein